jgi:enoyl-CoA hydratase/carnithine racemase
MRWTGRCSPGSSRWASPSATTGRCGPSSSPARAAASAPASISARSPRWRRPTARVWDDLAVPTIAAVHGVALGGGLQVALGADLRIVAADARLSVLEIRWGLVPDMTGTHVLPRLVGLQRAKELTWTGRMVSGEEAVAIGLATEVAADPRSRALELARQIAGFNPDAIRRGKHLLNRSLDVAAADQFLEESKLMGELIGSPNQVEAVTAWFEKRSAQFSDAD